MSNDITALMATMKAAAEKATPGNWSYLKTTPFMDAEISAENNTRVVNLLAGDVTQANSEFIAAANPANVLALVEALEKAQQTIAELEREKEALRPVGVMSEKAFHRLENSESRFIALWPRPGIYLPRKRPEDGVIVYARTAGIQVIEGEQKNG